jgi:hypothetical protein
MTENAELAQYLAEVSRGAIPSRVDVELLDKDMLKAAMVQDRNLNQFVVDQKYSLGLDEII